MSRLISSAAMAVVIAIVAPSVARTSETVHDAETTRVADALFFRVPVSRDFLLPIRARGHAAGLTAECHVESGSAFQVFLLAEREGGESLIAGRFRSAGEAVVRVPGFAVRGEAPRIRIRLASATEAAAPPEWLARWARAVHSHATIRDDDSGHAEFLAEMLGRRFQIEPPKPSVSSTRARMSRARRAGLVSPFEIFTGSAAIRESIQLDRLVEGADPADATVPLTEIQALALEDHPFDEMRAGRPHRGSKLARLCPRDAIYVRVKSLSEWFRMMDLTDRWGGSLLSTIRVRSRDFDVADRYTRQLGLGNELMARLIGTKLIGELALVASDPLLHDGTAVAVIFLPREGKEPEFRGMFRAQRKTRAAAPGVTRSTEEIEEVSVELLREGAGALRSYSCELGAARVFSNSRRLVARVVNASRSEASSMADAPDYRYYRALYPLDDDESAFVFLSQDWFRVITGPAWRIARGRRGVIERELRKLRWAWQWALAEDAPADPQSLASAGFLEHPAGLLPRAVGLDPSGDVETARMLGHGPLASVDETVPMRATAEEVRSYDRFRDGYSRYWRRFIDPVGVRLRVAHDEIQADTLILPLIENSIYEQLRAFAGGPVATGAAVPLPEDALGAVTLSWSPEAARVDRLLGFLADSRHGTEVAVEPHWFGRALTFGVADGDLFLTAQSSAMSTFTGGFGFNSGETIILSALLSSLTLPVFAAIELENPTAVKETIESALQMGMGQRLAGGFFELRLLHYRTAGQPEIHTATVSFGFVEFRFHFTFVDRWLLITTRPGLLERWIETVGGADRREAFAVNGRLQVFPQAFDLAARTAGVVWQERVLDGCLKNFPDLRRVAAAGRRGDFDAAAELLGFRPTCPEGGRYALDPESGEVRCSSHGTAVEPTVPLRPPQNAPAVRFVNDMRSVRVDFAFTEDGLRSRLHVKLENAPGE